MLCSRRITNPILTPFDLCVKNTFLHTFQGQEDEQTGRIFAAPLINFEQLPPEQKPEFNIQEN